MHDNETVTCFDRLHAACTCSTNIESTIIGSLHKTSRFVPYQILHLPDNSGLLSRALSLAPAAKSLTRLTKYKDHLKGGQDIHCIYDVFGNDRLLQTDSLRSMLRARLLTDEASATTCRFLGSLCCCERGRRHVLQYEVDGVLDFVLEQSGFSGLRKA